MNRAIFADTKKVKRKTQPTFTLVYDGKPCDIVVLCSSGRSGGSLRSETQSACCKEPVRAEGQRCHHAVRLPGKRRVGVMEGERDRHRGPAPAEWTQTDSDPG
ncbi:PREDICTED: uncharacterized protein LOC106926408 isoform X3 [Poecilia mexicana]|uniref:uncharacterized protein LOC106926408 isoform X3 n=1 Tax=Poecilia mexicana TaxID=48701 RepID=UPI00072DBB09|nr:PREDICTED: uncharacterized protein LOC106926408 isoform X3 [Poecilia mexicana]